MENMKCYIIIVCFLFFRQGQANQLYYYPNDPKTYDEARQQCENQGLVMVKIENQEELDRVQTAVEAQSGPVNDMWVGMYYDVSNSVHRWRDGEQVTWVVWANGEPNFMSPDPKGEDCVRLATSFKFKSRECYYQFDVICESAPTIPTEPSTVTSASKKFKLWPRPYSKEVVIGLCAGFGSFVLLLTCLTTCWWCGCCGRRIKEPDDNYNTEAEKEKQQKQFSRISTRMTSIQIHDPKLTYYN